MSRLRVLLAADDEYGGRVLRSRICADAEFDVDVVTDVAAARCRLDRTAFDCIVAMDRLPDGTGTDLVRLAAGAPVIIWSSVPDDDRAEQALGQGAEDFLAETDTDAPRLARSVRYAVFRGRRRPPRARPASPLIASRNEQLSIELPRLLEETESGVSRIVELVNELRTCTFPEPSVAEVALASRGEAIACEGLPERAAPSERAPEPRSLRILAIDDEALILSSYRRMLRPHDVTTVTGGREALELIHEVDDFDGILCDLMMPEVDGLAFHRALEQIAPHLLPRVAYCTGGTFTDRMQGFVRSISNPVLDKPLRVPQIETLTERWAELSRRSKRRTPARPSEEAGSRRPAASAARWT